MSRLIDADALKEICTQKLLFCQNSITDHGHLRLMWQQIVASPFMQMIQQIDKVPTIDPVRHARWQCTGGEWLRCSQCHCKELQFGNYCPNCGAKMDENGEE